MVEPGDRTEKLQSDQGLLDKAGCWTKGRGSLDNPLYKVCFYIVFVIAHVQYIDKDEISYAFLIICANIRHSALSHFPSQMKCRRVHNKCNHKIWLSSTILYWEFSAMMGIWNIRYLRIWYLLLNDISSSPVFRGRILFGINFFLLETGSKGSRELGAPPPPTFMNLNISEESVGKFTWIGWNLQVAASEQNLTLDSARLKPHADYSQFK